MRLVFWQNLVSPHQAALMRCLSKRGHEVTLVAPTVMTRDRERTGWEVPALGEVRVVIGPDDREVVGLVGEPEDGLVHVLAGARLSRLGTEVTRQCLRRGHRMGILTEAPDPRGLGGLARWGKYSMEWILRGRRYDFVLAMGQMGVRWFRRCGYLGSKVFPFCYVVDEPPDFFGLASPVPGPVRLLFVGRLVELKGVDDLLRALASLEPGSFHLEVVGDGPVRDRLVRMASGISALGQVEWLAGLSNVEARKRMGAADLLVLPSRKDGWGAVVNEALMAGTPVVCSLACGASELLRETWLGSVYPAGDVGSLSRSLAEWVRRGPRTENERARIRLWTKRITGECVAGYFDRILGHVYSGRERPEVPWRSGAEADL